jgi:hypothetical protein
MSGDEATAGLQTGQFAATIVAQIQLLFVRANQWAERTGLKSWRVSVGRVAAGLAIAVLFWAVGKFFDVDHRSAAVLGSFLVAIGVGVLIMLWGLLPQAPRVVVPYAGAVVAPLAFALAILLVLPFGPSVAIYSFLLEMSAEATPAGTWTIHQYEPIPRVASALDLAAPALHHSAVYDQSDVLRDLTAWMRTCATPAAL